MNFTLLKATAKSAAKVALSVTSELLDKGAELADEANDYLSDKDTSGREARKDKRTSIFGFSDNKKDET